MRPSDGIAMFAPSAAERSFSAIAHLFKGSVSHPVRGLWYRPPTNLVGATLLSFHRIEKANMPKLVTVEQTSAVFPNCGTDAEPSLMSYQINGINCLLSATEPSGAPDICNCNLLLSCSTRLGMLIQLQHSDGWSQLRLFQVFVCDSPRWFQWKGPSRGAERARYGKWAFPVKFL